MLKGRPLPDWYLDEPELEREEEFYISAFYDLDTCRSIGMDVGPIPWVHILTYAQVAELDQDLIAPFIRVIRNMDSGYRKWCDDKRNRSKA